MPLTVESKKTYKNAYYSKNYSKIKARVLNNYHETHNFDGDHKEHREK